MPPLHEFQLNIRRSVDIANPVTSSDYFAAQWVNPADIFSVLLLLGPEIVQQAVAQLAGRWVTPVAFSFGWVAYSARALLAVIGGSNHRYYFFLLFACPWVFQLAFYPMPLIYFPPITPR